jgi:hypothetical protein
MFGGFGEARYACLSTTTEVLAKEEYKPYGGKQ